MALAFTAGRAVEEDLVTLAGLTVLVAEDHEDTRDFLALVLGNEGCQVLTATNGREALELAAAHPPAAVLMDLTMPIMGGVESALRIQQQPGLQKVPIVACTGYETPHEWPPGLFASVLLKPVSPSQLLSALEKLVATGASA
jgi:CheY-like chemotaxis protein